MVMQTCLGKCGQTLPFDAFGSLNGGKRRTVCNPCRAQVEKERRQHWTEDQRQKHRDNTRKASKRFRRTAKGRAATKRSNDSPSSKTRRKKWAQTKKGRQSLKAASQRLGAKRRAWMQAEKLRQGCVDCGYNKHPAALDFDHVQGIKKFEVSKVARSLEALKAEIAKCVVRCSNCHRIKTYEERQQAKDKLETLETV